MDIEINESNPQKNAAIAFYWGIAAAKRCNASKKAKHALRRRPACGQAQPFMRTTARSRNKGKWMEAAERGIDRTVALSAP
ncbi:hypothetical protein GCM10007205_02570 [Oxalicibacterium flavum]|uniref:Uncharacterized protein n=1 Tax=Oxalicibacterium flavum TaxID=179467 RepID=A0A8J2UJB4_9BURK|nr:hypothetical protein [Oxalicibacterium flavum]GGB96778.1 hypothetical protein GCM10007205_02570 [Oxalicibacterium flavum]